MVAPAESKTIKRGIIAVLVVSLLGFFIYAFSPDPVPVDMAGVFRGDMQVSVKDEGYTRIEDVYVVSAPVAGRLLRIDQQVGDAVTAGETLLAKLLPSDPVVLDSRSRRQAEANLRAANAALVLARAQGQEVAAQLDFARSQLQRIRRMAEQGSASDAELDRAELALKSALATSRSAQAAEGMRAAELENAKAVLATADDRDEVQVVPLVSPISGRILRILQESENVVAAGTPLLELGDPAKLEVVVDLLSRDAVRVEDGAEVHISGWGGEQPLRGRVQRVEPYGFTKISALGIEEQRVNVIVELIGAQSLWQGLGHGYRVDAEVELWRGSDVVQVATGALFRSQGQWAVFRVLNNKAVLTPVVVGQNNGRSAQVLDGLSVGETVVLHPSERIADGVALALRER
ncbi:efflux RND transporter periplasmic adaptor subunit [Spongiibacter marinus]|uniref:efflux RND transporter periplasmic adaptor subunit n=1 Tax=Spongiibacter marinus TaxID=354246 RepID=UPI003569D238